MTAVWTELLSSALVGVGRRPCVLPETEGLLGTVLGSGAVDEAGLLYAAGVLTVARRAGATPLLMPPPAAAIVPGEAGVPGPAAARLGVLLAGVRSTGDQRGARRLLHEWLELAAARGLVAPAPLIPALLDLAEQDGTLRPLVHVVGGARAAWLAGLRPDVWGWSVAAESGWTEADWLDGEPGRRAAYLAGLRRRDPAAGRELLLQTWPAEHAADLAKLIGACRLGLGPDDEAWLEKALDDRRAQVRAAAVPLLQRLPGSAYGQRMADRVAAWCRRDGDKLAVRLPPAYDAAMKRDGIEQKSSYGRGERVWWLEQVVAAAPLDCWRAVDADPGSLLGREVNDDLGSTLRRALTSAALTQRDAGWALHLCRQPALESHAARPLVELLPEPQAAEVTAAAVRESSPYANAFLSALARPWPAGVCAAVLDKLGSARLTHDAGWRSLVTHAESGLQPGCAAEVEKLAAGVPFGEVLRQLAAFLHIRSEIHREFSS